MPSQTIASLIHLLVSRIPDVEEQAARRSRFYTGDGHGSQVSAPTPVNLTALDLLNQLCELALLLHRSIGSHPPTGLHALDLYRSLDDPQQTDRLDNRGDADHVARVLASALRHVQYVTEPNDRMRWVGVCPACGYGIWVSHYADIAHDVVRCDMCATPCALASVFAAHRLMLLMSDATDTAAGLARLLRSCGYEEAKRNTITQWARRGRLRPVGVDDDGVPVYRLADTLRLLSA